MSSPRSPEFERNLGFWTVDEQAALCGSHVALAGVGGDGYLLGLSLVRMGVKSFSVADPEVFELENINRVPGATHLSVGRSKVECFVEDARAINPDVSIRSFLEGVSEDNVADFISEASLVVDETELTRLEVGAMIADHAKRKQIPVVVVMNIGFAAQVTSYGPRSPGFRKMMGIRPDESYAEIAQREVDFARCVPYLPSYTDVAVLEAVQQGASLPSIVQGVNLASALGASQCFLHLTADVDAPRDGPIMYPRVMYVDSLTGKSRTVRNVQRSHRLSLLRMIVSRMRGRTPKMTYPA